MSSIVNRNRFQNNINLCLPDEITIYILEFLEYSQFVPIFRFSNKYFYEENCITTVIKKNEFYLHSKILVKKYPMYRLVSKYYYYIDFNSSCKFCRGRYTSYNRNLRCSNCGHVNNLKYMENDWTNAYKSRKRYTSLIKEQNINYKLRLNRIPPK